MQFVSKLQSFCKKTNRLNQVTS